MLHCGSRCLLTGDDWQQNVDAAFEAVTETGMQCAALQILSSSEVDRAMRSGTVQTAKSDRADLTHSGTSSQRSLASISCVTITQAAAFNNSWQLVADRLWSPAKTTLQ